MKTIAIIAPTGMLGSMVYSVLKDKYQLVLVYRDEAKIQLLHEKYGAVGDHQRVCFDFGELREEYLSGFPKEQVSPKFHSFLKKVGNVDGVINCVGLTKPYSLQNPFQTFFI